jgi:hypothetical protein
MVQGILMQLWNGLGFGGSGIHCELIAPSFFTPSSIEPSSIEPSHQERNAINGAGASMFSSNMNSSISCGTGLFQTGENDCRCRGEGP